uniref:Uncharacterized protein n=1 Tax=Calidris pygmaea TaxID=425635 RepID=A0A8C3JA12_9CHAR
MTRILTACKVVKTLKGRLEFCNVSADHRSFSRTGTRLLSIKVTVTEFRLKRTVNLVLPRPLLNHAPKCHI